MRKNKRNLRNLASIVNLIVNQLPAQRWGSLRKLPVDLTKIVTSKFAFFRFFIILNSC